MNFPRRLLPLLFVTALFVGVYIFTGLADWTSFSKTSNNEESHETKGFGLFKDTGSPLMNWRAGLWPSSSEQAEDVAADNAGRPRVAGLGYSRVMVVPCTTKENMSWIQQELPELETAIYVADDPQAPLHPPRNKGHEAMIYLSYIVDQYDTLPDIVLFMHAHRWTYHNNELQGSDSVQLIKALNNERVIREGYMNLRCHWDPGCPGHLHPLADEPDFYRLQSVVAEQWPRLFPQDPIPEALSQPCCAQFAVSRERIRSKPLSQYMFFRDWLLRTPLTDYYSGRIWEYLWQYVFTGKSVLCPAEHVCYCDGFGMCFGGEEQYKDWFALRDRRRGFEQELDEWYGKVKAINEARENGRIEEEENLEIPEMGRDVYLRDQIKALQKELDARKAMALQRGKDPRNRAVEAGREWDGDEETVRGE